ncbi:HNH endonuclease signature motif containing protein [Ornithinimicrobium sp. Y1847]|uniref:HNH endonuclease signature motif containing protein n=1 Tax=Ornithinimicrobium sp. Y1847 TaxID=3405419 RepID=UPI003CFC9393
MGRVRAALVGLGIGQREVELLTVTAETLAALAKGQDLSGTASQWLVETTRAAEAAQEPQAGATPAGSPEVPPTGSAEVPPAGSPEPWPASQEVPALVRDASVVLQRVGVLTGLGAALDAALVQVTRDLAVRTGRVLLADKATDDPGELASSVRARWVARTKSATAREIACVSGWGKGESADLVALATAPRDITTITTEAMRTGAASWRLVRRYWRQAGTRAHEDGLVIAQALFGTDPDTLAKERLTPEGDYTDRPWVHKEYYHALDREIARLDSQDAQARAQARERARAARRYRTRVHDDGTATVTLQGTATQIIAATDRLERAARAARAAGDPRTLDQLGTDIALSLLLHSTLNLPDLASTNQKNTGQKNTRHKDSNARPQSPDTLDGLGDDVVSTAWSQQMIAVMRALPAAVLNVIVPLDALTGTSINTPPPRRHPAPPGTPPPGTPPPEASPSGEEEPASASIPPAPVGSAIPLAPAGSAMPSGTESERPPAPDERPPAPDGRPPVGLVGQVTGAYPIFLDAGHLRELFLAPGTTMYRLLTDPADGRCVERSITSYTPDAAMRAQVHAADVTCRAPGCLQHAPYTQLDHVIPYNRTHPEHGGPTAEPNLQTLHGGDHDPKTRREWTATMNTTRIVTWRSLLGRIYRTRTHDYNQYATLLAAAQTRIEQNTTTWSTPTTSTSPTAGTGPAAGAGLDPATARAHAIDHEIYTALSYRPPGTPLAHPADNPWADHDEGYTGWPITDLTHTTTTGGRGYGPHPDTADQARTEHHNTYRATREATDQNGEQHADQDTDHNDHEQHASTTDTPGTDTPETDTPDPPPPF